MNIKEILKELKKHSSPTHLKGMSHFGIESSKALGVAVPNIRAIAKKIKTNQSLSLELWKTEIHEARILATMIGDPEKVSVKQMNTWVADFNSWDLCDHACGNLFDKTTHAEKKAIEYSKNKKEFIKRAGFVLMAYLAVHNKKAEDSLFISFLPIIEREAHDERNFVKKAVNWALRQIGKRNKNLHNAALQCSERILQQPFKSAKWIATDAIQELKLKEKKLKPLFN